MKISRDKLTKYLLYEIMMILMALSGIGGDINAVHTGFFVALIFVKEQPIIMAVMYIFAGLLVRPTLYTLIVTLVPSIVMCLTRYITKALHRRMTLSLTSFVSLLSLIPILVISILDKNNLINGIITLILTAIFTYLSIVAVFALVVKRLKYRLMGDEVVAILSLLVVMSMGLMNISIYGYRIYYTLMALLVLILASVTNLAPSMMIALAFGVGGGISLKNLELAGIICIMMAFCHIFMKYNRYYAIISMIALDLMGGLYFDAYLSYHYLHIVAVLVGCVIFLLIPHKRLQYYQNIYRKNGKTPAITSYITRNRIDINAKINYLAGVFTDIESVLTNNEYIMTRNKWEKCLAESVMCKVCANCPDRETCCSALGGDTLSQIRPLVDMSRLKRLTSDDVGTFLESRCSRKCDMVDTINTVNDRYAKTSLHICNVLDDKKILGEQIGSVGRLLSKLSLSVLDGGNPCEKMEERIVEELNLYGIVCHDVLYVQDNKGSMELTIVVRDIDAKKKVIRATLERLLKVKLSRCEDRVCEVGGFTSIRFVTSPKYMVSYHISSTKKDGSPSSGDSNGVIRIDPYKVGITLCDGKGSGDMARNNSHNTISIVENLYKAGFDSDTILNFANRLLSIRNSEDFTALDMCIVNLESMVVDFIKLGGVTSFIKRANSVDIVEGSALPLGVVEEAVPSTTRRLLVEGDIVVLVSDGITDSLGVDAIIERLMNSGATSLNTLTDTLLSEATRQGAIDDSTVIAFKLTKA